MANDKCSPDQFKKNLELIAQIKEEQQELARKKLKQEEMKKILAAQQDKHIFELDQQKRINDMIAKKEKAAELASLKKKANLFATNLQFQVATKQLTQTQADQLLLAFKNSNENCSQGTECYKLLQQDLLYTSWQNEQKQAEKESVKALIKEKKYYNFIDNSPPGSDFGYKKEVLLPKFNNEVTPKKESYLNKIELLKTENDTYIESIKEQIIAIERMNQYDKNLNKTNNKLLNKMDKHFSDSFTADRRVWYNLPNLLTAEWWTGALKIIFWIILVIFTVFMIYMDRKILVNFKFWSLLVLLIIIPFILPYSTDLLFKLLYNKENVLSVGNLTLVILLGFVCFSLYQLFANLNTGKFNMLLFKSQSKELGKKSKEIAEKGIDKVNNMKQKIELKAQDNLKKGKENLDKTKESIEDTVNSVKEVLNPKNLEAKAKELQAKAKELEKKTKTTTNNLNSKIKNILS